jgi:hypothetical protein
MGKGFQKRARGKRTYVEMSKGMIAGRKYSIGGQHSP